MTVSPKEYKEKNRKTIKIKSGYEFVIRRLSGMEFLFASTLPIPFQDKKKFDAEAVMQDKSSLKEIAEMSTIMICEGVVEPQIIKEKKEETENNIWIGELSAEDRMELLEAITEFSGLGKEEANAIKPFQEEPASASDRPDSPEIREVTASDSFSSTAIVGD